MADAVRIAVVGESFERGVGRDGVDVDAAKVPSNTPFLASIESLASRSKDRWWG